MYNFSLIIYFDSLLKSSYFYISGYINVIELILPLKNSFNVATGTFETTHVALIVFLWDHAGLGDRVFVREAPSVIEAGKLLKRTL